MALPDFSMRQLLEAGCHFGHQTHRWNPKMGRYIFGSRNGVHIIDLAQTVPLLHQALKLISDTVAGGGRILFVGTKRQASELIADAAQRSAQYYVNARWLGGMLTNWATISNSIKRLRVVSEMLEGGEAEALTKKERLMLTRERDKLERALGGIKDMGGTPDLLFVVDTNKESIAVQEARKLKIPVVAILDSNCNPDAIDYPIPGNDDAARAISLYCELAAKAAIDGIARQQSSAGVDVGASESAPVEPVDDEVAAVAEPTESETVSAVTEMAKPDEAPPVAETIETSEVPAETETVSNDEEAGDVPLFERPAGEPDDLKKITGVGPVLEKKLLDLGITRFDQIAKFTPEEIEKIDDRLNFKGRIERDEWVRQATELASENA